MLCECTETRFGKISPFGKFFKVFGNNFEGAFSIWQNFELTLAKFLSNWANLCYWQWPNIEQTIYPSSHTVCDTQNGCGWRIK